MNSNRAAFLLGCSLALAVLLPGMWALAATDDFLDLRRIEAVRGDATAGKEQAAVCVGCHGAAGISPVPIFPNLAGQHAEYLYWQLVEMKREADPASPMTPQVVNLDEMAMRNFAAYFSSLTGAVSADAPFDSPMSARACEIFRAGDPALGIPPCQGCHGVNGGGHALAGDDASARIYPILRAQNAGYIEQRLKDFRAGKHTLSSSDQIMMPIAALLDDATISALSSSIGTGACKSSTATTAATAIKDPAEKSP